MKKIILVIILIISALLFSGCSEQKSSAPVEFKQNVLKEEFIEETIIEETIIEETKLYENVITWDNAQVKTWD